MVLANFQTEWARTLFASFAEAGVQDIVISPGSRSTPFVIAALEQQGLTCHTLIDERAASFFALGQAKYSGQPSVLLCTSGSALANYMPAVVEAYEADVPLIVLSADRPASIHGCGENQTTDQNHFFGHHVRDFVSLAAEHGAASQLLAARRAAIQAVAQTRGPRPGPVHLNVSAGKPLEPKAPSNEQELALEQSAKALRHTAGTQVYSAHLQPSPEALRMLHALCTEHAAGIIALGTDDQDLSSNLQMVVQLSRDLGWPIVADATHPIRWSAEARPHLVAAMDALGQSDALLAKLSAQCVLQLGRPLIGNGWTRWLERNPSLKRVVVTSSAWPDPTQNANALVQADPLATVELIHEQLAGFKRPPSAGAEQWLALDRQVWGAIKSLVDKDSNSWSEPQAVRQVFEQWPAEFPILVGNSLPVRHINRWVEPQARSGRLFSRRGVSGIEGFCASAAGIASKAQQPTCLLVGDVSFLHDLTGIQALRTQPVIVVVLNNGGGRIFEELPIQKSMPQRMQYFTTPHGCDLQHAAKLFGIDYAEARDQADLNGEMQRALQKKSAVIINAIVPDHSAATSNDQLQVELGRLASRA